MATPEEYPPLPASVSRELTLEERLERLEIQAAESKAMLKIEMELLLGFCERELLIVAGEILKWSVQKRAAEDGEGCQLYGTSATSKSMLGLNPTPRDLTAYKEMSKVIQLGNNTAQFQDLEALERMVEVCNIAIHEWPVLEENYPAQVKIVRNYKTFKTFLPDSFQ